MNADDERKALRSACLVLGCIAGAAVTLLGAVVWWWVGQ